MTKYNNNNKSPLASYNNIIDPRMMFANIFIDRPSSGSLDEYTAKCQLI